MDDDTALTVELAPTPTAPAGAVPEPPGRATFRSLHVRNYRLFFTGQVISQCGTWMQTIAQGWLVLRLSHNSGVALGIVSALQFVPMLLLGSWTGLLADRFDKRRMLIRSQAAMALV